MKDSKIYFVLQNSHGHAKEFLRNLQTVWASALRKVGHPYSRTTDCYVSNLFLVTSYSYQIIKSVINKIKLTQITKLKKKTFINNNWGLGFSP
jgi:hypothetical protein